MATMKICSCCNVSKDESEFYLEAGRRKATCKICVLAKTSARVLARTPEEKAVIKEYQREYQHENPDKHKAASDKYRLNPANAPVLRAVQIRFQKNRRWKLNLLKMGRPCYDCGGMFPPEAMDWDHLPGSVKSFGLNQGGAHSIEDISDEIAKCQLVCANCHRVRTKARTRKSYE